MILIDSNVIIAATDLGHLHHQPSQALLRRRPAPILIATHALTEAYNHLSRLRKDGPSIDTGVAAVSLQSLAATAKCRALTHHESLAAVQRFAALGGRGARLYDYLIGAVAVLEGADTIATWNVRHFAPLFPALRIATPEQLLES